MMPIFCNSTNRIRWKGLRWHPGGLYVNDATVLGTLSDAAGNVLYEVTAGNMPYQAGTDGDYMGSIPSSVTIIEGGKYFLRLKTTGPLIAARKIQLIGTHKRAGSMFPLFCEASNPVAWKGLRRYPFGAYVNDASVAMTLSDAAGATLHSGVLSYQSGSNGDYVGTIPATLGISEAAKYFLQLTATRSSEVATRRLQLVGTYKGVI